MHTYIIYSKTLFVFSENNGAFPWRKRDALLIVAPSVDVIFTYAGDDKIHKGKPRGE